MVSLFEMKLLGVTKNHCEVYVDMDNSHAATHFADSPKLYNAVIQTLSTIELFGATVRMECDAGEEVGESDVGRDKQS
jgi:hypothetical protein